MNPLKVMQDRRAEILAQIKEIRGKRAALLDVAVAEKRALSEEETASFNAHKAGMDELAAQLGPIDMRIAELEQEARDRQRDGASRRDIAGGAGNGGDVAPGGALVKDAPIYARDKRETSYFKDLYFATRRGNTEAAERLRRNDAQLQESRALGNTGAAGGAGGEFAPPEWLISQFVALARPGRVAADLFDSAPLPTGISTINIPKVASGTSTAVQVTQNTALSQTDLTTSSLSTGIATVGGKQIVSLQLLSQSEIPFDRVILEDLAASYAVSLDNQALVGSGASGQLRGLDNAAGLTTQTYTQATPAVAGAGGLYANVAKAIAQVYSTRFMAPDTILMHPRRWAFICAAFDTQNRPLVVPSAFAVNPVTTDDTNVPQGPVGQMQGLPVYTDPNLPINRGAGTNQDVVYIFRRSDIKFWESQPMAEAFEETYADSAGVLFRLMGYAAMIPDRYGSSIVKLDGTGLVTPSF